MRFRELGKTGLRVSEVGLGGFPISGMWEDDSGRQTGWPGVKDAESISLIHRAEELGVNLIDTAESYGRGHSEEVIGRALAGRRDKWLVATKVTTNQGLRKDRPDHDAARRRIHESVAGSLDRLRTDYIDFYQLHAIPFDWAMGPVAESMEELRESGTIRHWGISTDDMAAVKTLLGFGRVEVLQIRYNLIQRKSEELLRWAMRQSIGTLIRVPLAKGLLTGKYFRDSELPPNDYRHDLFEAAEVADALRKAPAFAFLAGETGRTMTQSAIRFVLDNSAVASVLIGAKTVAQIEENVAASSVPSLTRDELKRAAEIAADIDIGVIF